MALTLFRRAFARRGNYLLNMKSLLRFILLFALIIIGKVAKEPTGFSEMAKAVRSVQLTPVQPVSLLQHLNVQSGAPAGDFQWHATEPVGNSATSFQ